MARRGRGLARVNVGHDAEIPVPVSELPVSKSVCRTLRTVIFHEDNIRMRSTVDNKLSVTKSLHTFILYTFLVLKISTNGP